MTRCKALKARVTDRLFDVRMKFTENIEGRFAQQPLVGYQVNEFITVGLEEIQLIRSSFILSEHLLQNGKDPLVAYVHSGRAGINGDTFGDQTLAIVPYCAAVVAQ